MSNHLYQACVNIPVRLKADSKDNTTRAHNRAQNSTNMEIIMISPKFAEILTIIEAAGSTGITSSAIVKAGINNSSDYIIDSDTTSKLIYSVRSVGLITTSDAARGKVHKITKHGQSELDGYKIAMAIDTDTEKESLPKDALSRTFKELNDVNKSDTIQIQTRRSAYPEEINKSHSVISEDTGQINESKEESRFYLDRADELDAPFIQIITAMREASAKPEPIFIKRKQIKIDTLTRFGLIFSDDIKAVFDDICSDIERLSEA